MITIVEDGKEISLDIDPVKVATLEAKDLIYKCKECNCYHLGEGVSADDLILMASL